MRNISERRRSIVEGLPDTIDRKAVESVRAEKFITQTRRYKLITPLFGGGSETKKTDAVQVIRGTEVRGHLRFWWRALRGVGTIQQMREKESVIFGASASEAASSDAGGGAGASKLKVVVKIDNEGKPSAPFFMNDRKLARPAKEWEKIAYVAFPLQPTSEEVRENQNLSMKEIRVGVEFTLDISFLKTTQEDVEGALWAWETFGGIGGRTRRGFGSLQLLSVDDESIEPKVSTALRSYVENTLRKYLAEGDWRPEIPHLSLVSDNFAFSNPSTDTRKDNAIAVWETLIQKLQSFRQSPRNATIYQGESHWPEPDAIRRLTKRSAKIRSGDTNSKDRTPSHTAGNVFPRGQLGLPIIFKFKNDDVKNGDPDAVTLQGRNKDAERLASPLILRPIVCSDGAVGLALALDTPREPAGGVILKDHTGSIQTTLNDKSDIASIQPMKNASTTETDVVKSFLKTI